MLWPVLNYYWVYLSLFSHYRIPVLYYGLLILLIITPVTLAQSPGIWVFDSDVLLCSATPVHDRSYL